MKTFLLYYIIKSLAGELKKKQLSAVYCKLTFVAKNLIGPLSCDCKNACVFSFKATNMEDVLTQQLLTTN